MPKEPNIATLNEIRTEDGQTIDQTIIVSTHNKELAKLADRKLEIKDGKII